MHPQYRASGRHRASSRGRPRCGSALPERERTYLLLRWQNDEDQLVAAYNRETDPGRACDLWEAAVHIAAARQAIGGERWERRPWPEAGGDGDA